MNRAAGAFVLILVACQGAGSSTEAEIASRAGAIDLQIGLLDGPAPYLFGRLSGIVEDSTGRIFVSDFSANEIRVFDPAGGFLFSFGREGQGPGEFRGPCCLALSPEGELWARDGGNRRYVGFRIASDRAEPIATLRMAHSDGMHYAPLSFAPDEFIDIGYHTSPAGLLQLQRFHLGDSGSVLRSELVEEPSSAQLGTVVKGERTTRQFFPQPYGPRFLVAYGSDGIWASAVSSRDIVTLHDLGGATRTINGQTKDGPPLSSDDRASAERMIDGFMQMGGGIRSDYPEIPERKAPLAGLMFDQAGQLWVSLNTVAEQPARAILYDREGRIVGETTWPRHVSLAFPAWIGRDHAIGITTDSLGVQRIARVQFSSR